MSQNTGYDLKTFFLNANEARSQLYIKTVSSQLPGAIARTIAYGVNSVTIGGKDCKTKNYLNYPIDNKNFDSIQGRYFVNPKTKKLDIVDDSKDFIIGTMIQMRSPIYCQDEEGICEICYGKMYEKNETKYIGLNASRMSDTIGIQRSMKSRHKSSTAVTTKSNLIIDLADIK